MKKNYFTAFRKSAGYFPVIILAVLLSFAAYISYNETLFQFVKESGSVLGILIEKFSPALFISLAVAGLIGLRYKKINLIDTFRFSNVLGAVLSLGLLYHTSEFPDLNSIILISACGGLSLIEIFIRAIGKKDVIERMGFNGYMGAIANSFNPICSAIISLALFSCFAYFKDNIQVQDYAILYSSFVALILLVSSLVISINKSSSYANFIDVLYLIGFKTITLIILYSMVYRVEFVDSIIILFFALSLALLLRGFTFSGDYKSSKLKSNRYFAQLYSSHSVLLALLISVAVFGFFVYSTYLKEEFFFILNVFDIYKNPIYNSTFGMVISFVLIGVCVLNLLFLLILKNIKSPEIEKVDIVVSINSHLVLYGLPIIYFVVKDITNITANILPFIAVCVYAIFALISIIVQFIRLKNYQGILIEDIIAQSQQKQEVQETETAEAQEAVEENPATEEPTETVEEVEDTQEEIVEEEAPAEGEEVEEEIIYVDEDGNEVEAPAEGEEVEEEIIYVDEDGNEISAEEAQALENQEEIVEEEVVQEEVVQEEQPEENGEEQEELDDEAEEDADDSEDEELEEIEEESEEVEEAEEPQEEKKSNVLVNDFEVFDAEGKPKKIRTKFNSKLMYAAPETKDYYSEIKNYLVMYRAKGRFSSRCETFRYKGLIAKVALGGKAVKVFLAIDPTSLEGSKYHYKDMSAKKQYVEVPTMIKVRSPRGLKYFKELVDLLMAARGVKPKRGFEPTDYTADLIPNGEAILGKLGLSRDVLGKPMTVSSLPDDIPDNIEDYIPAIQGDPLEEAEVKATVYLDTLCSHFVEGEEVTIDVLKSLHIVTAGNVIHVKARGAMDRSLKIYAEYFDADALKVLMATNSTAVKIIHDAEEVTE